MTGKSLAHFLSNVLWPLWGEGIQGLFWQSICGAETGRFGLISENFDPFEGAYPLIYRSIILTDLYWSHRGQKFVENGRKSADGRTKTMPGNYNVGTGSIVYNGFLQLPDIFQRNIFNGFWVGVLHYTTCKVSKGHKLRYHSHKALLMGFILSNTFTILHSIKVFLRHQRIWDTFHTKVPIE